MALTQREIHRLSSTLTKDVHVLASGIAEMHLGSPNPKVNPHEDRSGILRGLWATGADKWHYAEISGAVLLLRNSQGLYFRIYELKNFTMSFQYELYENLNYLRLSDNCQAFEMENWVCAFNFSDAQVANKFFMRVQKHIVRREVYDGSPQVQNPSLPVNVQIKPPDSVEKQPKGRKGRFNTLRRLGGRRKKSKRIQEPVLGATEFQKNPMAAQPVPSTSPSQTSSLAFQQQNRNESKTSFGSFQQGTLRRGMAKAEPNEVHTSTSLLDPNNVPKEWKRILKAAGIRKRDLRNPEMFEIIKDVLAEHDIAIEQPEHHEVDEERLQQVWNEQQMQQWRIYQEKKRSYEEDKERYEREMAEYKQTHSQQKKLDVIVQSQRNLRVQPKETEEDIKKQLRIQKKLKSKPPPLPPKNVTPSRRNIPQLPREMPNQPALPPVPESAKKAPAKSKVVFNKPFLGAIKNQNFTLKKATLPTFEKVEQSTANGIMAALRERVKKQREVVGDRDANDKDDESDDFSDFVDEEFQDL